MVRKYVRKKGSGMYQDYSADSLSKALKDVREKKLSIRQAAKKYKIPKSTIQSNVSTYQSYICKSLSFISLIKMMSGTCTYLSIPSTYLYSFAQGKIDFLAVKLH